MFKLYIAGKITGDPHYSGKFALAENVLCNAGFTLAKFFEGFCR